MTRLVRADNPGPMTLEGTNTWLVGTERVLVVDPGPADPAHLAAVLAAVSDAGGVLGGVLLTHRHPDHADALGHDLLRAALAAAGAPVLALDPAYGVPPTAAALAAATDEPVRLLPMPGHTDDSAGLVVPGRREVVTGDTVLGRGTSVVAHPDGDLGDYLASLDAVLDAVRGEVPRETQGEVQGEVRAAGDEGDSGGGSGGGAPWRGLPGHGPVLDDLAGAVLALRAHRLARVEQVRAALADRAGPGLAHAGGADGPSGSDGPGQGQGAAAPDDEELVAAVVAAVYPGLDDPVLIGAAARTVRATLVHLARG